MPSSPEAGALGQALAHRLEADLPRLSPKLRGVAMYVVRERAQLHRQRIQDVARRSGTVPATVVRLAQRYGLEGFHELKLAFVETPERPPAREERAVDATVSRVFDDGDGQALCIPSEFRLDTDRVLVCRTEQGDLIIRPLGPTSPPSSSTPPSPPHTAARPLP